MSRSEKEKKRKEREESRKEQRKILSSEEKELRKKRKAYREIMKNWDHNTMKMYPEFPLSKEQKEKEHKKYLLGNAKGGIVKKFKGGLMVKPKAAKRGY